MDLLERYLQAVGQYLPSTTRGDVLEELRANLQAQMDDRTEELGHPLSEIDVSAILLQHGKPEIVALHYLPQRSLIGPAIFPFYEMTIRRALPVFLLVYAIAQAASLTFSQGGMTAGRVFGALLQVIPDAFLSLSVVTAIFAAIEVVHGRYHSRWEGWEPGKLAPLRRAAGEAKPRSMASRVADLVLHCLWMLYVLAVPAFPFLIIGPGAWYLNSLYLRVTPVWHTFYILLMILLWVQLAIRILALRDGSQSWKTPLEFATKLLSIAAVGTLAVTHTYLIPSDLSAKSSASLGLAMKLEAVNHAINLGFRLVLFLVILQLLVSLWKYLRPKFRSTSLAF